MELEEGREANQLRSDDPMSADGEKFDFDKHCIFCPSIAECNLPAEYPKCVPRQKHKPAYKVRTNKSKDSKDHKEHVIGCVAREVISWGR